MARRITDDEREATDTAAQSSNGQSGWEEPEIEAQPIGFAPHKGRHTYRDGICIKCGRKESDEEKPKTLAKARTSNNITLEMMASGVWLLAGVGLENLNPEWPVVGPVLKPIASPVEREDGSLGVAPSKAAGRMMQLEATIAGKRIDKALKGTVVAKFINALLNATGPWAELVPLILPPLIMGAVAAYPAIVERFPMVKALMVGTMLPVLKEAAKMADEQEALKEMVGSVDQESIAQAWHEVLKVMASE